MRNKSLEFSYCLTWANHPWTRTWTNRKGAAEILFEQKYEKNTIEFDVLARELVLHFKDDRYVALDGKPLFSIYKISDLPNGFIENLRQALKNYGFEIFLVGMLKDFEDLRFAECFDGLVPFNPSFGLHARKNMKSISDYIKYIRKFVIKNMPGIGDIFLKTLMVNKIKTTDYKLFCEKSIKTYKDLVESSELKIFPMACCGFDNTPRYGRRATILTDYSDDLFEQQVRELKNISQKKYASELFFINAWNEWGEGMHLEGDEKSNFNKIVAFKKGIQRETFS